MEKIFEQKKIKLIPLNNPVQDLFLEIKCINLQQKHLKIELYPTITCLVSFY